MNNAFTRVTAGMVNQGWLQTQLLPFISAFTSLQDNFCYSSLQENMTEDVSPESYYLIFKMMY